MSTSIRNRRNVGILGAIVLATVVLVVFGTQWLRGMGFNFVGEVAFALLILIAAVAAFDRLLVR